MLGEFGDCLILKRRSKIDYGNRNLHVHEDKCMNGTCVCVCVCVCMCVCVCVCMCVPCEQCYQKVW